MFDFLQITLSGREPLEHSGSNFNLRWRWLARGVLQLEPLHGYRMNVVLSAGIHGNETAPIELLAALVSDLLHGKRRLKVRLLVIFGNPMAMVSGERYNQIDLNRLFSRHYDHFPDCIETARAEQLELLVRDFYDQSNEGERLHFDLHTAIRESHHQRFGLLPHTDKGLYGRSLYSRRMLDWLHHSGIEALVINQAPSGTFSYFTSQHCHADSCTLELGKARPFGHNDLNQFALINQGLISLITGINLLPYAAEPIKVYRVTQELIKITEQFRLNFSESVKNFTRFSAGDVLARDGEISYQVQQTEEWILFPNASVRPGLRAGLMLVQVPTDSLFG
ncbi:succinylglutamate desuccinylase [uncultured Tolumonas sp.]|uniref:succinylglutamate desuccinylase n=1 Tax=uncultured Tolumonas sp. TaxID=263765 RepID=UPI00292E38ED|nr:succinylglutamate desuccinylase [uncultured Tolumonas sp.]